MKVLFNDVGEFLEELAKDTPDRKIVRITNLFKNSSFSPNIKLLSVIASYTVQGQLVRLERYCGDIWEINEEQDNKIYERAQKVHAEIKEKCEEIGCEVRAGSIEEE